MKRIMILIFGILILLTSCSSGNDSKYAGHAIIRMPDGSTIEKEITKFKTINGNRINIIMKDGTKYTTGINNVVIIRNTDKD